MSLDQITPWIDQLTQHLHTDAYTKFSKQKRISAARRFLVYLQERQIRIESVQPSDVQAFLQHRLDTYRRRHGRQPNDVSGWRWNYTSGIHLMLRLAQRIWPPLEKPSTPGEQIRWQLGDDYAHWLQQDCGLVAKTAHQRRKRALQFLQSLGNKALSQITISDLDHHLKTRALKLRRVALHNLVDDLRNFLRYLHGRGKTPHDFSHALVSPRLYALEGIPPSLRVEDVNRAVETTRKDRTAEGLRDFAILLLLSTYGLRAGEIMELRLEDIDWRNDRLRIRHSKTGTETFLPLLAPVGEAILRYLQKGRPTTNAREVFIRTCAPLKPLRALNHMVTERLKRAGIKPGPKHGAHAFRHARAVSLLNASVPLKVIGDVLGHRSPSSTTIYLKLATSELRSVGLEIPKGGIR